MSLKEIPARELVLYPKMTSYLCEAIAGKHMDIEKRWYIKGVSNEYERVGNTVEVEERH